jgi:uncharacterized protein (UPF0264 family)
MDLPRLGSWIADARAAGLITAVAGSLILDDVDLVLAAAPNVVGVRGAVCKGGRDGRVDSTRVRAFREKLAFTSGSLQGASLL